MSPSQPKARWFCRKTRVQAGGSNTSLPLSPSSSLPFGPWLSQSRESSSETPCSSGSIRKALLVLSFFFVSKIHVSIHVFNKLLLHQLNYVNQIYDMVTWNILEGIYTFACLSFTLQFSWVRVGWLWRSWHLMQHCITLLSGVFSEL